MARERFYPMMKMMMDPEEMFSSIARGFDVPFFDENFSDSSEE